MPANSWQRHVGLRLGPNSSCMHRQLPPAALLTSSSISMSSRKGGNLSCLPSRLISTGAVGGIRSLTLLGCVKKPVTLQGRRETRMACLVGCVLERWASLSASGSVEWLIFGHPLLSRHASNRAGCHPPTHHSRAPSAAQTQPRGSPPAAPQALDALLQLRHRHAANLGHLELLCTSDYSGMHRRQARRVTATHCLKQPSSNTRR